MFVEKVRQLVRLALTLATLGFIGRRWRIPCFAMIGVAAGLAMTVAHVARATSYLGNDPDTCINCHVMYDAYLTWKHSSHANVATCFDCHVPHDNIVKYYAYKASDGARHTTVFTMRAEPQVLQLSSGAIPVVQANCQRCHEHTVHKVHASMPLDVGAGQRCWDCHRDVPHSRVRSLSGSVPIMQPRLPPVLPRSN